MARRSSHPFDALVERFAQMFAERVSAVLPKAGSTNGGLDGYTLLPSTTISSPTTIRREIVNRASRIGAAPLAPCLIAGSEVRLPRPGLLADLLDEGLRATSVRALVIHDLHEQPRLRVLAQDRGFAHFAGELRAFGRRGAPGTLGRLRRGGSEVRRLCLGDVVESGRRVGSPARAMAAGTGRGAAAEGVPNAAITTTQAADVTLHGSHL